MTKVTTMLFKIDGELRRFDVHYNSKKQFHLKDFPQEILLFGAQEQDSLFVESHQRTEHELKQALDTRIQQYHDKKATSRKVIIYSIKATTNIRMNKDGPGCWSGTKAGINEKVGSLNDHGYGVSIEYKVAMESHKNGVRYNEVNEDGEMRYGIHVDSNEFVMEWTPQREKTFQEICAAMENMVKKLSAVICDDKKFEKLLDTGAKLLPA